MDVLASKFFFPVLSALFATTASVQGPAYNITAISAFNNASRLECWTLPSIPGSGAGALTYDLGNFEKSFIGILPPRTYRNATITHAPSIQFTIALSGLIHIMIPNSDLPKHQSEAWIHGGKYGFVIAADTKERSGPGHVTEFPSDEPTWLAQFPVEGNVAPEHELLHVGPCEMGDLVGL
ncbi:hypothetical protein K469DRAFT_656752 [Zopfia rhizophila CBS 207.26]|uniref:Small secreted protein n=1 Tax=Zopfia rhizophila CBS 207.26 TaxID=1314779 RepID=A0A6A6EFC6_9PEZI|nr:hypothetical protein K469DRAFT_656752 [Zopfia rhizophila CBS 207.26]